MRSLLSAAGLRMSRGQLPQAPTTVTSLQHIALTGNCEPLLLEPAFEEHCVTEQRRNPVCCGDQADTLTVTPAGRRRDIIVTAASGWMPDMLIKGCEAHKSLPLLLPVNNISYAITPNISYTVSKSSSLTPDSLA